MTRPPGSSSEDREAAYRNRVELERYRGIYKSREELLEALGVEYASPPRRRTEHIPPSPDDDTEPQE